MPILDLQTQTRELGRIRIGEQVATRGGGSRPAKLEAFRFTTNSSHAAARVADLYGGDVRRWEGGTQTYQVNTTAVELDVMVPAGDLALSQWWELWTAGGCQRRCDGLTEQRTQEPCKCPPAGDARSAAAQRGLACKPTTRVNVILPDLPDLGQWRYESHGYYAAVEMAGTADLLSRAREVGQIIPARMRLEQRSRIAQTAEGPQTRHYPVVVLEIGATLRELVAASGQQSLAGALPPAPGVKALAAPTTSPPVGRAETVGEAEPPAVSPTAPTSAQRVADEVRGCKSAARLTELAQITVDNRWQSEMVTDQHDVLEGLWDLLTSRREELMRGVA